MIVGSRDYYRSYLLIYLIHFIICMLITLSIDSTEIVVVDCSSSQWTGQQINSFRWLKLMVSKL